MRIKSHIIIVLTLLLVAACTPKEKMPPPLPSVKSLSFDFSFFEQNSAGEVNYLYASDKVTAWKALLKDSTNIHNAMLNEAAYNEFVFQKEQTWLMSFPFTVEDSSFNSFLFGIIEPDTISFNTLISNNIDTVLYLEGKFDDTSKSGRWTLNKPGFIEEIYTEIMFLTVDWTLDSLDRKEIIFTDKSGGENNLSYFLYKDSIDSQHDSYIDIYDKGNDSHSLIKWNSLTKQGRIQDQNHFGDENWHCWNENYQNIDCN